ncbi:MAG: HNH endonuclease [Oligoflexia bacterium]|nr:HNH endonuclease [Oligoflexia bacterium]
MLHSEDQAWAGPLTTFIPNDVGVVAITLEHCSRFPVAIGAMTALERAVELLAQQGQALDLRLARLVAWFKTEDLSELGYPGFGAFCRECVAWKSSWLRSLVRLAQSPLQLVKDAVCQGWLPLSAAIEAPGHVSTGEQVAWLAEARQRSNHPAAHPDPSPRVTFYGADAALVRDARQRARLWLSWRAPASTCDGFVLDCFEQRLSRAQLLGLAFTPPPLPDTTAPSWCQTEDPATPMLGKWEQPRDLHHGLSLLGDLQALRRGRLATLGLAVDHVVACGWFRDFGFSTLGDYARDVLGMSLRTLQRLRRVARVVNTYPQLRQALDGDLDLDRCQAITQLVDSAQSVDDWLGIARKLGVGELQRVVQRARMGSAASQLDAVRRRVARLPSAVDPCGDATDGGGTTNTGTTGGTTNTGTAMVAAAVLPPDLDPGARARAVWAPPDLLEAARWFLDTATTPPQGRCAKVKLRDRFVCQNPECARRTLRVHAHHLRFRSRGGSDDPDNLLTLCPSCHLRLIHTGRVVVRREGDRLVWRYPGRIVWVG